MKGYLSEIFVSFQGEGARVGERHLFLRLAGCNLRCRYCDTPYSLERCPTWQFHDPATSCIRTQQNPVSPAELAALLAHCCEHEPGVQMLAITGGEPLLQAKFLRELFAAATPKLPVLLETNGMLPEQLALILPDIDVVSMDIKLPSNTGERAFWEEHRAFLQLARSKECYVKVTIDNKTAVSEVKEAARIVCELAPQATLFLQPIVDGQGRLCADSSTLATLFAAARKHHEYVRVLPQVHKLLGIP